MRYCLERPGAVPEGDEGTLRYAFSLARVLIEGREGDAAGASELERSATTASIALFGHAPATEPIAPEPELVSAAARRLWGLAAAARDHAAGHGHSPHALDELVRHRRLALALGGGGGSGYVYLGCFQLLEEWGLRPSLIAGTSMGAVLGLLRARHRAFDIAELLDLLRELTYRKLFRLFRTDNRYSLPGAFRLYLRAAFRRRLIDGVKPLVLGDLAIPFTVTVTGIRAGMLPRPVESYERLLDVRSLFPPTPRKIQRKAGDILAVLSELIRQPHRLDSVILGADDDSRAFDALDAVGFSCSLPGVIHYDVLRRDPAAHDRIGRLLAQRELGWLADGGLVENCPARAAHLALRRRAGGRANPFVLALDGFSPKLLTPAWLALERLAHENVRRSRPWASVYVPFPRTLSPLEIVPSVRQAQRALALGRAQLAPHMPLLARMLTPLPDLAQSRPAAA